MRYVNAEQLAGAPLPDGPLAEAWQTYLGCWTEGRRREALAYVDRVVDLLVAAGPERCAAFAQWVCSVLFDDSDWWAGQWGGGMMLRDSRWERPVEPALTVHPIAARVLLPYLVSRLSDQDGRHMRWMYQFAVGQAYRLPPREQQQLRTAVEARCGLGEPLTALLRHAGNDVLARRLINDAEAG